MQQQKRWMVMVLAVTGLAFSGCAETSESEDSGESAAKLVAVEGSDVQQVILTERAAERLDIQTGLVTEEAGAKVIPYASVVYDADGDTWVYTRPEPFTFVRAPITVASITGDVAILLQGPETGTEVVTVGTAELFGTEQEIGQ